MGEIEGVGEAVTGGLLARAVEPTAGEARSGGDTGACLNCGAPLAGPYCASCGQKAQVHRSLRSFGADFLAGLLNFEGKFWRTLPMLAWRPGELTRCYIDGQRARFISPVALYLFSVFLMFAVLSFNGVIGDPVATTKGGLQVALDDEQRSLERVREQRRQAASRGEPTAAFDRRIAAAAEDIEKLKRLQRGEALQINTDGADQVPAWAQRALAKAQANPERTVASVQDAASKYSWLLIPLSLPFMWLLFPFSRRFRMYDHTVFVTYSLSFMMILVIAGGVLVAAGQAGLASLLVLVPPVHMYRQLKGAYRLGGLGALVRTFALLTFCLVAIVLFAIAIAAIGMLG